MADKHEITSQDKWFLDKHMKDPVAQEPFKIGDTIVICSKCKTAHYDSTWAMNSNKCCSLGCNHSIQLRFEQFSPVIFKSQAGYGSKFNVIAEKLTFSERLKLFNGYPIANMITVILPFLIVLLLFWPVLYQAELAFDIEHQLSVIQSNLADLNQNGLAGIDGAIGNLQELDIEAMGYKSDMILQRFDSIELERMNENISDKLGGPFSDTNFLSKFQGVMQKLLRCMEKMFEIIQVCFDS